MDHAYSDDFPPSFLYQRYDAPGAEFCGVRRDDAGWWLEGKLILAGPPVGAISYAVHVDAAWRTRFVQLASEVPKDQEGHELRADGAGQWWLDGRAQPQVAGALDVDFEFSPLTNLLPIRRLDLPVGAVAGVRSAWLRLRPVRLEPLEQRYRRMDSDTYEYEAWVDEERFRATLRTTRQGLITRYGDLWAGGVEPSDLPPKSRA